MRTPITALIALVLLVTPAIAQNTTAQSATAKDNKQAAPASKDDKSETKQQGQQAQSSAKDDSISNYDVNGSNAADAMGGSR